MGFLWLLLLHSLPSKSETTSNILPNDSWTGCEYEHYHHNFWGGTTGGSSPHCGSTQINWGYGGSVLTKTVAINQALQEVGIQVEGFSYSWGIKNFDINNTEAAQRNNQDPLVVTVDIYKSNGDLYATYEYDYSYDISDWTAFSGSETFSDPFLDPSFFGNLDLSVYGRDAGYWAGYYGPEFETNPTITLTYSSNPCYSDPLYDVRCDGYAEAYALKMLEEQMAAIEATPEPTQEQTYEEPVTVQDTSIQNSQTNPTEQVAISNAAEPEDQSNDTRAEVDPIGIALNAAAADAEFALQNIVNGELGGIPNALESTQNQTAMGMGNVQTQNQSSSSSNQNDSEERETQGQKLKRAAKERAAGLQKQIVDSEEIDEQQAAQQEMLVMMNFVPGFDAYKIALAGGTYPDVAFYAPTTIPDSKDGARNNFAQQLLHQQMVDMQYQ